MISKLMNFTTPLTLPPPPPRLLRVVCFLGSKGSTTICSVPLISARQKGHPPPLPSESCGKTCSNYCTYLFRICCILYQKYEYEKPPPTCQAVRQCVQSRWPQGSIRMSLLFSAQILHSWNVEPISQYSSYCSWVTCTATTVKYFSSVYKYFSPAHKYFYLDMILGRGLDSPREVGVDAATVGVKVTGTKHTLTYDHHWYFSLCKITYNPSLDPSSRA